MAEKDDKKADDKKTDDKPSTATETRPVGAPNKGQGQDGGAPDPKTSPTATGGSETQGAKAEKGLVKADRYEGIPRPAPPDDLGDMGSRTIPGGAFWVNNQIVNANGEPLDDDKIAKFREHHARLAKAREASGV